jgi:hypothetical protein
MLSTDLGYEEPRRAAHFVPPVRSATADGPSSGAPVQCRSGEAPS